MPSKAQLLFDKAFSEEKKRTSRSPEYRAGVLTLLQFKFGEIPNCIVPYKTGTAQADAWFAGTEEGRALYNDYNRSEPSGKIEPGQCCLMPKNIAWNHDKTKWRCVYWALFQQRYEKSHRI